METGLLWTLPGESTAQRETGHGRHPHDIMTLKVHSDRRTNHHRIKVARYLSSLVMNFIEVYTDRRDSRGKRAAPRVMLSAYLK
jgi:hypothetical protein